MAAPETIGPYRILSKLGEGGMGTVYRATDSKLNRDVAVKVLPGAFSNDPDRLARFRREAQVLAALNHPNIAAIYGVEDHALILELVEGPTLADRIAQGPVPLDEALAIARQIGEALDAAHERGVVHRDLKPANIKITPDGCVKVLDFGLAKAMGEDAMEGDPANSPTLTIGITHAGVILGTAGYMSPEQAKGKRVDRRADIWSFGVVLYEMLTGQRLYAGETVAEILAGVLAANPDLTRVPPKVRRLLASCLQKDPKQRLRDIGDAWRLLEEPAETRTRAISLSAASASILAIAAFLAGAMIAAMIGWRRPKPEPQTSVTLSIVLPAGNELVSLPPVISPDGMSVSYATADLRIYVRRIDSLNPRPLPGTMNALAPPFWSSDSSAVFYNSHGQLVKVWPSSGAQEVVSPKYSRFGALSDTGAFLVNAPGHCLDVVPASGAAPETLSFPPQFRNCFSPEFLPASDEFVFTFFPTGTAFTPDGSTVLSSLRNGKASAPSVLLTNFTTAHYTPAGGGRILYVRGDNLYSQKLDPRARRLEGEPELVIQGVGSDPRGLSYFSVARNGTIAWVPGGVRRSQIVEFDRSGRRIGTSGPPGPYRLLALSPDGARLLVNAIGAPDVIIDVGEPEKLDLPPGAAWIGWSGNGARVLGVSNQSLFDSSATGLGEVQELGKFFSPSAPAVSYDGKEIIFGGQDGAYSALIDGNPNDTEPKLVMKSSDPVRVPNLSPDRHWVVYDSLDGVYVRPFPGPGQRRRIGSRGVSTSCPVWRPDGNEILYFNDGDLMSVPVTWRGEPSFAEARKLFSGLRMAVAAGSTRPLAVSRDGSRIFWIQGPDPPNVIDIKTFAIR